MFTISEINLHRNLILGLVTVLVSCGGGGSSTPPPPAQDTTPPVVVATKPSSEQTDVKISSFIEVTFSEAVANVDTNQVEIYPYNADVVDTNSPVKLKADPFFYNAKTKTLSIRPEIGALKPTTRYQVTLHDIKDNAGVVMVGSCQWDFGTTGQAAFGTGLTGVCGTTPDLGAPGKVESVTATAGDGVVSLNWQAPASGGEVTYYKVDKSTDNKQSFSVVNANVTPATISLSDTDVVNNQSYIYRIIAANNAGQSDAVFSASVTPKAGLVSSKPLTLLSSNAPAAANQFGSNIVISPDGLTLAVTEAGGDTATLADAGTVQLFTKSGSSWIRGPVFTAQTPEVSNFGGIMVFSSDGLTLAVAATASTVNTLASAGSVQLFTKSGNTWNRAQLLTSQTPKASGFFGYAIAFSPNGNTFVVGEHAADNTTIVDAGNVQVFSKSGTSWIASQLLTSQAPATGNLFGVITVFSPDGMTLAVLEYNGEAGTVADAGNVQLFNLSGATWTRGVTLTSQSPAANNLFGFNSIVFSSDGNNLAIGEQNGDAINAADSGAVHLFTKSGSAWNLNTVLTSQSPASSNQFGGTGHTFSPDSMTLAIGEYLGDPATAADAGTVQIFVKSANSWNLSQVLTSQSPALSNAFGISLDFNPSGTTLAIGEYLGDPANGTDAGTVQLFVKSGTTWTLSKILSSQAPALNNLFGQRLIYTPDGSSLIITEPNGDPVSAADAGVVNIFDSSQF